MDRFTELKIFGDFQKFVYEEPTLAAAALEAFNVSVAMASPGDPRIAPSHLKLPLHQVKIDNKIDLRYQSVVIGSIPHSIMSIRELPHKFPIVVTYQSQPEGTFNFGFFDRVQTKLCEIITSNHVTMTPSLINKVVVEMQQLEMGGFEYL